MQTKYPVDRAQLCRLDQLLMRHLHRMQGALQLLLPKGKKALQLRKIRKQIVVLPKIKTAATSDDLDAGTGFEQSSGHNH